MDTTDDLPKQTPPSSFAQKLYGFLPTVEKALVALLAMSLMAKYINIDAKPLLLISLAGLAGVYYLGSFRPLGIERKDGEKLGFMDLLATTHAPKMLGISSAVLIIGLLFFLQELPRDRYIFLLMIGNSGIVLALVGLGLARMTGTEHLEVLSPILLRAVPLLIIGGYIFWMNY